MRTSTAAFACLVAAIAVPAAAEDCKAIKDSAARLACFDKAAGETPAAPVPAAQKDEPATPATEPAKTFKVVDAADLYIATAKYADRDLEIRGINCYYADKDDYRCIATGPVTLALFANKVEPQPARNWLEHNCDQIKTAVTSNRCKFTVRFQFPRSGVKEDIVSGYQQRKVIVPTDGLTMVPVRKKK